VNPFPLILSSPSGGGKTTIARMLLDRRKDLGYSISCTTRTPRNGEVHGQDYHFLSRDDFVSRRARGEFAESAEVHGNLYGTLRSEVDRVFSAGRHVVMDTYSGRAAVRRRVPRVCVSLLAAAVGRNVIGSAHGVGNRIAEAVLPPEGVRRTSGSGG
jgi:guanylate kinase